MTITGLNADLYYSDNPIYISFEGIDPDVKYIDIYVSQIGSFGQGTPNRIYLNDDEDLLYDISPIVKAQFRKAENNTDYTTLTPFVIQNNWRRINFVFTEVLNDLSESSIQISKTFVKGGKRVQETNQHTSPGKVLSPVDKIPQWAGLPVSYNYFNTNRQMVKANLLPPDKKELRKNKGCNPLYLKFRNSLGGYSYWYFENWEEKSENKSLGYVSTYSSFYDLGNEENLTIEATSKVPKRFYPLIKDLINSPEIYMYKPSMVSSESSKPSLGGASRNDWERIKNSNNKSTQNLYNSNEKVKLKFERILKYNPSELWSN